MRSKAAAILIVGFCLFLFLCTAVSATAIGAGAPLACSGSPPARPHPRRRRSQTLCEETSPLCQVTYRLSDWWQHWEGISIRPLEQHDESEFYQWVKTWVISTTQPGWVISATVVTYRCPGHEYDAEPQHCGPEMATSTVTHNISFTMPISRVTTFSITDTVNCCELDESDLVAVSRNPKWTSSFFLRSARAPVCPDPTDSDANADRDANRNEHAHRHGNAYCHRNANRYRYADRDGDRNGNSDSHTDGHGDSHCDADGDSDCNSNRHANSNTDGKRHHNRHSNRHRLSHTDWHSHSERNAHGKPLRERRRCP